MTTHRRTLRDAAEGHAIRHQHHTMWMPVAGWVCRECDDLIYDVWAASDCYQEFFDGTDR